MQFVDSDNKQSKDAEEICSKIDEKTVKQLKELFKDPNILNLLVKQLEEIQEAVTSIIIIYQKIYIKVKQKWQHPHLKNQQHEDSLFMIKIGRSFPVGGVSVHLLDGCFQPKIFDSRNLVYQILGESWSYEHQLKDIIDGLGPLEEKLLKRNEQFLALQKTGQFMLGEVFIYNELQEHTSLNLFVDRTAGHNNTIVGVSETHFLTFKKVLKKFRSKEEQEAENRSKSLYGKKFMLSRCCDIQCIQTLNINAITKEVNLTILKYKSIKSFNEYETLNRKFDFGDEATEQSFVKSILKNITKFQPMKISFTPSIHEKQKIESKEDSAIQKVLELNELQARLDSEYDLQRRDEILKRLHRSYQKLIEFYSARANPYYLIYVNKLNYLYAKYFVSEKGDLQDSWLERNKQ